MASCRLVIQDEVNIKLEGLEVDVRRKIANALKFEVPYARYAQPRGAETPCFSCSSLLLAEGAWESVPS